MAPRMVTTHEVGDQLADRYRLRRWLGEGGMGVVWAAEDEVLHRPVAVKVVAEVHRGDESVVRRFEREARTAAQVVHPNLATVFDYGQHEDELFLVMELLEGDTWGERLRAGPMPAVAAAEVAAEVADGLDALHRAGIVHRDVKPSNVVLTDRGAKLLDFGIASGLGEPLTATGNVMGTAAYLSPERVQGQAAGPPADVYALGAVLFEAVSGRRPFPEGTPSEVALAHVHGTPPDLADLEPEVPPNVAAAVRRCLAKAPDERPSAADLAALLRGEQAAGAGLDTTAPIGADDDRTAPLPLVPAAGLGAGLAAGGLAAGGLAAEAGATAVGAEPTEVEAPAAGAGPAPPVPPAHTPPAGMPLPTGPVGPTSPTGPVPPQQTADGRRRLVVAGALLGLLLVLVVAAVALSRGGERSDAGPTPTTTSTTAAPSTTTTAPPTTTTTAPPTTTTTAAPAPPAPPPQPDGDAAVAQAADAARAAIEEGREAGELEGRVARALLRLVDQAEQASSQGDVDDALGRVDEAEARLDEAREEDEVEDDRASTISQALSDLRSAIQQAASDGEGGGGGGDGPGGGDPGGGDDEDDD